MTPQSDAEAFLAIVLLLVALFIFYFLPAIVARWFRHPQTAAIFMLNFLFGWTGIGWGIALIWAFTKERKPTWR